MDMGTVRNLMEVLWKKYEYASILHIKSEGKKYSASGQGLSGAREKLYCQDGYVIKAYGKGRYAEYSFNELKEGMAEDIMSVLDAIFEDTEELPGDEYEILMESEESLFTENKIHDDPRVIGDEKILECLKDIREAALKIDGRLKDCRVNAAYKYCEEYFLSPKRELSQKIMWMTGHLFMMVKKGEEMKSYFEGFSNLDGAGVLDEMKEAVPTVAAEALKLIDSESITPGEYECVCAPDVTGIIVHEAFGHGVEMDMFVKDRALAREYIGKPVASELVTMHDGAAAAVEAASYTFDDEGSPATDTVIIEKGILKTGISDSLTALSLKSGFTGNGRRESFERKAYTRMTNTFFEGGKDTPEAMIASVKYGFLLENATCGMEDPKNWGIQCMVNVAKEIRDGKLTGRLFSPVVLSGYVPDLLKSISMMSGNVKLSGSGFCGKGYKEWVKVSDGGPYIKAKIKLG